MKLTKHHQGLLVALLASLLVHAMTFMVRMVPPSLEKTIQTTPIDIILLNSLSKNKTHQSTYAQTNLIGGGEREENRAKSPIPYSGKTQLGSLNEKAKSEIQSLQKEQLKLLAEIKKSLEALSQVHSGNQSVALESKRALLSKTIAELENRIEEENKRPRKQFIGPSTTEIFYAVYYDKFRKIVEKQGTSHFPEKDGVKLYGTLTLAISLDLQGRVIALEVIKSSGNLALDKSAQEITKSASPFEPFTENMKKYADILVIVCQFNFLSNNALITK
ncbi:MAG: TonB family protein [Gammaproteobacteria bacterium]|nr:TonB family protein [Gammaproteobacteria bacterium]